MSRANQLAALFCAAVWRIEPAGGPLRNQVYRQLRDAVTEGRVAPGAPVPSTRVLARVLGVSRSTLVEAIEQLRIEGFLETRQGAATRIARLDPRLLGPSVRAKGAAAGALGDCAALPGPTPWPLDDPPTPVTLRAFRPGLPDLRAFPAREWATHLARRARQPASHDLSYVSITGMPALRAEIVRHVAQTRHVAARPEQVIVLPSAQTAFDVAIRCTLARGDTAWVEDPGYPGMRTLLSAHGAQIVPVPVDDQGLQPSAALPAPRLIYVTPSHQYPTGAMLSLQRRLELLDRARRSGAVIVEDDYDSEFQIRGQPIASLQGLDRAGCVLYVGTFSKSLAPGLRVAYLIVPPRFVAAAEAVALAAGLGVPVHVQLALADFMVDGGLRRHLHRMGADYAARLTRLAHALLGAGGPHLRPASPAGGLQLCAALTGRLHDVEVVARLQAQGLLAVPLSTLCHGEAWRGQQGLVLGIGLVPLHEIDPQAYRLCAAVAAMA